VEDMVKTWQGRRVFLTGHTGFKGSWLALWLSRLGAQIRGYSLDPCTEPNMFSLASVGTVLDDVRGDIRDYDKLEVSMTQFAPEVIFHLAHSDRSPLVRRSRGYIRHERHGDGAFDGKRSARLQACAR